MHKGQARFQDDRLKWFVAWCAACWWKREHGFDSSLSDDEIIESLKREHAGKLAPAGFCPVEIKYRRLIVEP